MVTFEVRRRDAMILRIELSSIRSSPSFATGLIAWTGVAAGAGATAVVLDLTEAARPAAAVASDDGAAEGVFAAVLEAAVTSLSTIRPPGPVPVTLERFTPSSAAILRARGETFWRSPEGVGSAAATWA